MVLSLEIHFAFFSCVAVVPSRKEGFEGMRTRIKELRARYDLTQEYLAKKFGIQRETTLKKRGTIIPLSSRHMTSRRLCILPFMIYSSSRALDVPNLSFVGVKFDLLNVKYELCAVIFEGYSIESVGD
jgi:transcriptional regulator with XRE-family HTH domain